MAPDADHPTIHIRCGSDIFPKLREAGFTGDLLEFSDPVCIGPIPNTPDLLQVRAAFIAQAFGQPEALSRLQAETAALEAARHSSARIVIWSEHDSYDQLVLARLLDALAGRPTVELICIATHPSPVRFIGLGQLTPTELRALWPGRTQITPALTQLGQAVWNALRDPSPQPLHAIALTNTPALPPMAAALYRHLQELPWATDGLSLTERLILQSVQDGATTAGQIFAATQRQDPLPFMGDTMVWAATRDLAAARTPALELAPADHWPARPVRLTPLGTALLQSKADWQHQAPPDRWVGGVHAPMWRWAGHPNSSPLPSREGTRGG